MRYLSKLLALSLISAIQLRAQSPGSDDLDLAANGSVSTMAQQPDGGIVIGGTFTTVGNSLRSRLCRINADGTLDSAFDPGVNPGGRGQVIAVAVQPDGKILVGGDFTNIAGRVRHRLARINGNGTLDDAFNPNLSGGPGAFGGSGYVSSLALQPDGKILVGGIFTNLGGQPRNSMGRLNSDGSIDSGFDPQVDLSVSTIAVQPDGRILVGGVFNTLGGEVRHNIGRLLPDGTVDATFKPLVNGQVYTVAVQADGRILIGGVFTSVEGQPRARLARISSTGTLDTTFDCPANHYVYSLALQADGRILVGGEFTNLRGKWRSHIARLNADGSVDEKFDPSANNRINSIIMLESGKMLIGGEFSYAGGQPRSGFARLITSEPSGQILSFDGTDVTWVRSGGVSDVWHVKFEHSGNGTDWVDLGPATRFPAGWKISGAQLPSSGQLRVRGMIAGDDNSAGGMIESILMAPWPLRLRIARYGLAATVSWPAVEGTFQLQQSADLGQPGSWQDVGDPVQTNSVPLPLGAENKFLRIRRHGQ